MPVKLDAMIIQAVIRVLDEEGNTVEEKTSNPVKVFKAVTPDIWAEVEKSINPPAEV